MNLIIVIPAYNEEKNIKSVLYDWSKLGYKIILVDDGSTDNTSSAAEGFENVEILKKPNGGHGSACIAGYRRALEEGADCIFQTDSDGQTSVNDFPEFLRKIEEYDMVIGNRRKREDGFSRIVVTRVLRLALLLTVGKYIKDANTPFRLMKREFLEEAIGKIPEKETLPNVFLSAYAAISRKKVLYIDISFKKRTAGKNSLNMKKIFSEGFRAVKRFRKIKSLTER